MCGLLSCSLSTRGVSWPAGMRTELGTVARGIPYQALSGLNLMGYESTDARSASRGGVSAINRLYLSLKYPFSFVNIRRAYNLNLLRVFYNSVRLARRDFTRYYYHYHYYLYFVLQLLLFPLLAAVVPIWDTHNNYGSSHMVRVQEQDNSLSPREGMTNI